MKQNKGELAFGTANYRRMLIGIGIIALGFIVISLDQEEFGFGILGLTVGPVIVMAGFTFQFFAILHQGKETDVETEAIVAATQEPEPKAHTSTPASVPSQKPVKKMAKRKKK